MISLFSHVKWIEWLHLPHHCHRYHLKQPWLWDKQDVSFRQLLDHAINQNRQIFWIKIKTKKTGAETTTKKMPTKRKVVLNTKSALNNYYFFLFLFLKRCCNIFLATQQQQQFKIQSFSFSNNNNSKTNDEKRRRERHTAQKKGKSDPFLGFLLIVSPPHTHSLTQTNNRLTSISM